MSKEKQKQKRPKDINQLAYAIVAAATGDKPKEKSDRPKDETKQDK